MERPDENLDLPQDLKAALRGMYTPPTPLRADDARILAASRMAGTRLPSRWKWAVGMGIAAAVAVTASVMLVERGGRSGYARTGDIRDAFYVARELKSHRALEAAWDSNGDGIVDEKDVHALAAAAVRLPAKGGRP
jgi:hypothetical protein